jgi:L-ascorbate metabolism protein UlaG (beta-lactamase superfamily)
MRPIIFFFCSLLASLPLNASEVKITYLANEGVMIECGSDKILIDALFRDSLDQYARHPPQVQEEMETGKPPFDGVTLALATHFHLDHWDAGAITRFLTNNPHAVFASTPQATAMLPASLSQQIRTLWPEKSEPVRLQVGNVVVDAFSLEHGDYSTTQNLGYRISVCQQVLFHLGDAGLSDQNFAALTQTGQADVAMVPWWLLDAKGGAFIKEKWKPRHLVVLHFGGADGDAANQVVSTWPQAWVCTKQRESRTF